MSKYGTSVDFLLSQVRDSSASLAGGKVYFYAAGTSTPQTVWVDRLKETIASNPYTLDSNGTAQIFADGLYRIVIKDPDGVAVYDRDNLNYTTSLANPWADIINYEGLADAVSKLGSTNIDLLVSTPQYVTDDLTVPSNIHLVFGRGGKVTVSNGKTLTIDSPISAGMWPIFDTTGSLVLKNTLYVYPEWWTENTTPGTTDMSTAINAASRAVTGPTVTDAVSFTGCVKFHATKYRANSTLTYYGAPWKGSGYRSTMIEYHGSTVCLTAEATSADRKILDISDMTFNGANASASTDGIHLSNNHRSQAGLYNVEVSFFPGWGIVETGPTWTLNHYGLLLKNNTAGGYYLPTTIGDISTARNFYGCIIENNGQAGSGRGGGFHSPGPNAVTFNFYGGTFQSNKGLAELLFAGGSALVSGVYFETETDALNAIYLNGTTATVSDNLFYGTAAHGGSAVLATSPYAKVTVTGNLIHDTGMYTNGAIRAENEATITAGFNNNATYKTDGTLGSVIFRSGHQPIGGWFQDNIAANQSYTVLQRSNATATAFSSVFNPVRNGQVFGMVVILNATVSAGTLTVEVTKNGTPMGGALTATIISGSGATISLPDGQGISFLAGDNIGVRISTSADFAPTTADMTVTLDIM